MARIAVRHGLTALCLSACAAASWVYAQQAATPAAHAAVPVAGPAAAASMPASETKPVAKGVVAKQAAKGIPKGVEKPYWNDMSPAQQEALLPLAAEWDKQPRLPKKKWLDIANRYHALTPDEQQRVHERMRDWIKLTPAQRTLARENYTRAKKIGVTSKSEQWEQYQRLPEAQKRKLAAQEAAKKHLPVVTPSKKGELPPLPPIKPGVILPPPMVRPQPSGTGTTSAPPPSSSVQPAEEDQRHVSLGASNNLNVQ